MNGQEATEKIFLNTKQLSQKIGTPAFTIRKLTREGIFPAYRVTKKTIIMIMKRLLRLLKIKSSIKQSILLLSACYCIRHGRPSGEKGKVNNAI